MVRQLSFLKVININRLHVFDFWLLFLWAGILATHTYSGKIGISFVLFELDRVIRSYYLKKWILIDK
jgi:hypothetical protein